MFKQKAISDNFTLIGINSLNIQKYVENDKVCNKLFIFGKKNIKVCSKIKHRIELLKLSSNILDYYLVTLIKKLQIIIDIKTNSIINYWKDKCNAKPLATLCNCRNKGFGFCFCLKIFDIK